MGTLHNAGLYDVYFPRRLPNRRVRLTHNSNTMKLPEELSEHLENVNYVDYLEIIKTINALISYLEEHEFNERLTLLEKDREYRESHQPREESKCCGMCSHKDYDDGEVIPESVFCRKPDCECHSPKEPVESDHRSIVCQDGVHTVCILNGCVCACHENKLNKPYEHETKCCDKMNGATESTEESWEEGFRDLYFSLNKSDSNTDYYENTPRLVDFISRLILSERADERRKLNDCTCKEKWTFGVVHRKDGPCYWPPQEEKDMPDVMRRVDAQVGQAVRKLGER